VFFNNAPIGAVATLYEAHCLEERTPFAKWVREAYPDAYRQERGVREAFTKKSLPEPTPPSPGL
jgi:hypothetical protein